MKILSFLLFFLFSINANSQCNIEMHNTTWFDGWISCNKKTNPNPAREKSHWIKYNLGQTYQLGKMQIWNLNAPRVLDDGINEIVIDYSQDGIEWFEAGEVIVPQATGKTTYEGVKDIFDFKDVKARYILITVKSTYGTGNCAGFSELKIEAEPIDDNESICIIAEYNPNPVSANQLFVKLTKSCTKKVNYKLLNAVGKIVINTTPIALYETQEIIHGKTLAPGVYYLVLFNDFTSTRYKIVIL